MIRLHSLRCGPPPLSVRVRRTLPLVTILANSRRPQMQLWKLVCVDIIVMVSI